MKQLLSLIICFLSFPTSSVAQTLETFDIATFQPPTGWNRQAGQSAIQFSTEDKASGAYCLITLFKSVPGLDDSKQNFAAAWQTIVMEAVNVSTAPQMQPSNIPEGWKAEMGSAPFEKDGAKGVAVLVTVSGHGKMVNALVLTNTQAYEQAITAFLESVSLKKPETSSQPVPVDNENNASILGTWGSSQSDQSAFRVNNAVMSYITREYTFDADGTYRFISKAFDPFSTKLLFGKETGTYRVSGNSLTITPKNSVLEGWSKKNGSGDIWGTRLDSQNRKLENVTYRFTRHYFSGVRTWSLVLQADQVTQRDGPFSGGTAFSNAWIYSPPCDACFIELPR